MTRKALLRWRAATLIALWTFGSSALHADWTTLVSAEDIPEQAVFAVTPAPNGGLWCVLAGPAGVGVSRLDEGAWTHYTTADGLASSMILWTEHTIAVGLDGALWVATFDAGLSCFDGQTWTTYTTEDGLQSNDVAAVAVAPNGDIWVGHPHGTGGASHFDGEKWTRYSTSAVGQAHGVVALAIDPGGTVWAGFDRGLSCFDEGVWSHYNTPRVVTIEIGPDGTVWGASDGVIQFRDGGWTHHAMADLGVAETGDYGVMSLAVGADGTVWAGTDMLGLFRYDGQTWTRRGVPDELREGTVFAATATPDGPVFFASEAGLFRYLPDYTAVTPRSWGQLKMEMTR